MNNELHQWAIRHHVSQEAIAELAQLFTPRFESIPGGSEAMLQQALRIEAPKRGNALWRNNNGATLDESGRMVRYGVGNDSKKLNEVWKSSDLIGITPVHWYGRTFGVFTAVECKKSDWHMIPSDDRARAQAAFGQTVESLGGIFTFARSVNDYIGRVS